MDRERQALIFNIFRKDVIKKPKDLLSIHRKKKFYELVNQKKKIKERFNLLDQDEQIMVKWGVQDDFQNKESKK